MTSGRRSSGQGDGQVRLEPGDANGTDWQFRVPKQNDAKILDDELSRRQGPPHPQEWCLLLHQGASRVGHAKAGPPGAVRIGSARHCASATNVARTFTPVLERASVLIAELDVLASLAYVAAYSAHGYVRPTLTDSEEDGYGIELKEARHPCVELQDNVEFIPNDISLIYGSRPSSSLPDRIWVANRHIFDPSVPLLPWHRLVPLCHVHRPRSTSSITFWRGLVPAMCRIEVFRHSWPKCSRLRRSCRRQPSVV